MEPFLAWLQELPLSIWVAESGTIWGYPFILFLHSVGMGLSAGLGFIITLRLLGVGEPLPVSSLQKLFPFFWAGFILNFITGSLLFMAAATITGYIPIYYAKLLLIGLAVLTMLPLRKFTDSERSASDIPIRIKTIAAVSLLLWIGVIATGRLTAYVK